jgi:carbamoyl-phosphate synthase large subunit
VQFAVNPRDGDMVFIEMNPRVSRSSALASKATGFPIARIGAKLPWATGSTRCPTTSRAPRRRRSSRCSTTWWSSAALRLREFAGADPRLTTQMKSVGESMAIGRTFREAFQKALRALETGRPGWAVGATPSTTGCPTTRSRRCARAPPATPERIYQVKRAMLAGMSVDEIHAASAIDRGSSTRCWPWSRRSAPTRRRPTWTAT